MAVPGLSFSRQTLSCCLWDLVPWPGLGPRLPAFGAQSLSHCSNREGPWGKHLTCIISFNSPSGRGYYYYSFCWKKKKWGSKRFNNLLKFTSNQMWIQIQVSLTLQPVLLTTVWYCLSASGLFLEKQCFQRREVRGSIIVAIHQVILTRPSLLRGTFLSHHLGPHLTLTVIFIAPLSLF